MNKSIKASDLEALNTGFAEQIAGWQAGIDGNKKYMTSDRKSWHWWSIPRFIDSVDAVLPYLEKQYTWNLERDMPLKTPRRYLVSLYAADTEQGWHSAWGNTLAHAAVICLLRAAGVDVIDDE